MAPRPNDLQIGVGRLSPEIALWTSVIVQLLADSRRAPFSRKTIAEQQEARRYLTKPSADLHLILSYLGVDPDWWHRRVTPSLREQWRQLDQARLELDRRQQRSARNAIAPQVWARTAAA
jgi:hypothetical protein